MDNISLRKMKSTKTKDYYDLYINDDIVGSGWIRKKDSLIKKGMYIKIKPQYRRKGYGTIMYRLMLDNNIDLEIILAKLNKYNKAANAFVLSLYDFDDSCIKLLFNNWHYLTISIE